MKILLFTICVLMSIHAAISTQNRLNLSFCENLKTCSKNYLVNDKELQIFFNFSMAFQPTISAEFNYYQRIPNIFLVKALLNKVYDASINTLMCAFKRDGVINQEGKLLKHIPEQYCKKVFTQSQDILQCQMLAQYCTNYACSGLVECTAKEVRDELECKVNHGLWSLLRECF